MNWITDERGSLLEVFKLDTDGLIFCVKIKKGYIRGNHYHLHKIEKFCVIQGDACIGLETKKSFKTIEVSGDKPQVITMKPKVTHSIEAYTDCILLVWSNEYFSKKNPDTYKGVYYK